MAETKATNNYWINMQKLTTTAWLYIVDLTSRKSIRVIAGLSSLLVARKIFDLVRRKWYNLPPGPIGIPFWGTLHQLADFNAMTSAGEKYGAIHLTYFGMSGVCLINDIGLFHSLFSKKEFDDRELLYNGFKTPPLTDVPLSKEYILRRKLFISNYVSALNSKILTQSIENAIKSQVSSNIDKCINNRWLIRNEMSYIAFSTIYASIFNKLGPASDDESFLQFVESNHEIFSNFVAFFVAHLYFDGKKLKWFVDNVIKTDQPFNKHKEIVSKWFDDNKNIDGSEDIMKKWMLESNLSKDVIIVDTMAAFEAGMHTTATTMEQCILHLAECGIEYQNELYNEIKEYLKLNNYDNNEILKNSKKQLPLLTSFIFEVLRQTIGNYTTIPRFIAKSDYKIEYKDSKSGKYINYTIPKGTTIYGNIVAMNFDQRYFENPFEFNPKRFIENNNNNNNNGIVLKNDIGLTTFGYGRRDCAGQTLAKREIYLTMVLLIEKYQFLISQCYKNNNAFKIPRSFMDQHTPMLGVTVVKR